MAPKVESARTTETEPVQPAEARRIGAPVVDEMFGMFDIPRGDRRIEEQIATLTFNAF
jgi:hypothetical protein